MNQSTLRELAKIGSGLVLADMASAIWLASAGLLPMTILGVTWTTDALPAVLLFDSAILLLLIHYGWHMKLPIQSPSERVLLTVVGIIFLVVGLVHLSRLAFGYGIALGDFDVPLWISWIGVLITAYLSYASFHFAWKMKRGR